eukprot:gene14660-biopygen23129
MKQCDRMQQTARQNNAKERHLQHLPGSSGDRRAAGRDVEHRPPFDSVSHLARLAGHLTLLAGKRRAADHAARGRGWAWQA